MFTFPVYCLCQCVCVQEFEGVVVCDCVHACMFHFPVLLLQKVHFHINLSEKNRPEDT